jgi:hypothetical protein
MKKKPTQKKSKNKKFFGCPSCPKFTRILFLGHNSWTKISILIKISFPSRYMYNVSLQTKFKNFQYKLHSTEPALNSKNASKIDFVL